MARETSRAARGDIGHDDMPALVPSETSAEEATPQCVLSRSGSSGEEGAQPGAIVIVCCWSHARPGCRGRHRRKVGGRSPLPRKLAVSQMWRTWCRRRGGGSVPSVTGEGRRGRWRRHTRRDDWPMRAPTGRRAAGECRAGRRGLEQVSAALIISENKHDSGNNSDEHDSININSHRSAAAAAAAAAGSSSTPSNYFDRAT